MTNLKRSWDVLEDSQRKEAIDSIINFFATEREETIGVIAAGEILDTVLQATSKHMYNRGVEDTQQFFKNKLEAVIFDIEGSVKKS